jgi:hypothetical protein
MFAADFFLEKSRMGGEQIINVTRRDESFDYASNGFISVTTALSYPWGKRFRLGPGIRVLGIYSGAGQDAFEFGFLVEALLMGEVGIPLVEKWEMTLGGRLGLPVLFPRGDFGDEIRRLQVDRVGVWSLPRIGWIAGITAGAKRQMTERLWLRADLNGQLEQIFLFATDELIEGFAFRKNWSAHIVRVGLTVGLEVTL